MLFPKTEHPNTILLLLIFVQLKKSRSYGLRTFYTQRKLGFKALKLAIVPCQELSPTNPQRTKDMNDRLAIADY